MLAWALGNGCAGQGTVHGDRRVQWGLQLSVLLDRNLFSMRFGVPTGKARGFYSQTQALWISNATGRGGSEHRRAPERG
ncbi:DUF5701 family protein [Nesterenkonia cremea]|uniref:DUF5701 family protein n=1 Tax=Nesterenkonia cremea TaxID=1882340 RepID=UPI00357168B1